MQKKIILWVSILVILAVTVYVFVFVFLSNCTPTPVVEVPKITKKSSIVTDKKNQSEEKDSSEQEIKTDNWQTYRNERYEFELKHPLKTSIQGEFDNDYDLYINTNTSSKYDNPEKFFHKVL